MTDRKIVKLVVWFIGLSVLMFGGMAVLLAWRVLDQSSGKATVDAAAVGVIGIPAGLATTALGFLGGMLVSTRSQPSREEIAEALAPLADPDPTDGGTGGGIPVTVAGQTAPLETTEVPPPTTG